MSSCKGPSRSLAHRSAINAVAMLLVLGVLSNAPAVARMDADASAATLRELQRDLRHARDLSAALAKAVRDLVGETQIKLEHTAPERTFTHADGFFAALPSEPLRGAIAPDEFRESLMNLPPPAIVL